jgi:hypothetical protein
VSIPAPAEHFVLRSGTPKNYVKTAESGNKRRHAFCGNCGTPIYACAVDKPQSYSLCVGTITQRGLLTATADLAAFCAGLGGCARRRAGDRERGDALSAERFTQPGLRTTSPVPPAVLVADLIKNASTPCV